MRGKNYIDEMKMLLEEIHDRLSIAEEKISKFEDIATETMQNKTNSKMTQKINKIQRISEFYGNFRSSNTCVIGVNEQNRKRTRKIFEEIMA